MSLADYINTGLLLTAVVGIAMTYWQVRSSARTQRASFLKDLYSTLTTDADICEAYYLVEYGRFKYGTEFHGSNMEPKIDRLLAFTDLVCELYQQQIITSHEMEFFRYRFLRLATNPDIKAYLQFLSGFYAQVGLEKEPFHSFAEYARKAQ